MSTREKVSPGQSFSAPSHKTWNNMIDAADKIAKDRLGTVSPRDKLPISCDIVKVKNSTGADLTNGEIICLDDFLLDALSRDSLWFDGKTPTSAELPYGVLLEPIPNGLIGRVQVSGVCVAKIDQIYASHPFAHIKVGEKQLQTDWHGQAEILHRQQIESQWWAVVRLSNYQSTDLKVVISETGGITAGSSGGVDVWFAGAVTSPLQTLTAYFDWMAADTATKDAEALIRYFRDEGKWTIINLECA